MIPCFSARRVAEEVAFHGVTRSQQTDSAELRLPDRIGGGISNMDEWDLHGRFDLRRATMHGVRANQDAIGAATLESTGGIGHNFAQLIPVAADLQRFDLRKIDRQHQALRIVLAAKTAVHFLIDETVILDRGCPTHAAD